VYSEVARQETPTHVTRHLDPAERVVVARRLHFAPLVPWGLLAVGVLFAAIFVDTLSTPNAGDLRDGVWIVCALVWLWFVFRFATWWGEYFVLTNKRILIIGGLISRTVNMMPLTKVTDMAYRRSARGRLIGYGLFDMESAGQDQALRRINYVPDPDRIYLEICHLLFGDGD
jgi:uncharacterized membrane protein YdbT with pleckstrin-like domain